jgi:hypothetical protein
VLLVVLGDVDVLLPPGKPASQMKCHHHTVFSSNNIWNLSVTSERHVAA